MASPVLFISPAAYPFGGVADWLDYLLPGLSDFRWECVLGLVGGRHHAVGSYLERHPWSTVERIKNPTGSSEGRIQALASAIENTRPDILAVVNIVDAYEAVRRLRLAGKAAPRVVATLHGLQSDLFADLAAESDVIDAVIATNRLSVKLARQSLNSEARVLYAPYGVPQFNDVDMTPRSSDGVLRLLYSGRLEQEQKRIFDLPDLLAAMRDLGVKAQLALAGGGPDESALRSKFAAMNLHEQVSFLGVLNPQELAQEYCKHDALVITSVWETGPIVAWEAMSHGLPVLSSRYAGSGLEGALVDEVNSLLFPVGDMQEAAKSAMKLAQLGLHAQIVQGGLDLLRQRYSRRASIEQWDQAFRQVLDLPLLGLPKPPPHQPPSGRLDRLLGVAWGERVRRGLGHSYPHQDPGGEWPHSRHALPDQRAFIGHAKALDEIRT